MANIKKTIKRNIKKNKEIKNKINPMRNKLLFGAKILYVVLIATILVYAITIIVKGEYKFDTEKEVQIDYSTILAGQTFNRNYDEYYVIFYDVNDNSTLTTAIANISTNKIFKVDMGSGLNKTIMSETSNKKANNASELKVNGSTLIKIEKGNNVEYVEGENSISNYLKNLK